MRTVVASTVLLMALLAGLGVALMLISSSSNDDELESGNYRTIEEAEKAVGFAIPHAREMGAFTLDQVHVSGGTKKPGDVKSSENELIGEYGSTRTEWSIVLRYRAESDQRFISISLSPRPSVPLVPPKDDAPEVHGQRVSLQKLGNAGNDAPDVVAVSWLDNYGFIAFAALDSPQVNFGGVTLEEFLQLVRSVK